VQQTQTATTSICLATLLEHIHHVGFGSETSSFDNTLSCFSSAKHTPCRPLFLCSKNTFDNSLQNVP